MLKLAYALTSPKLYTSAQDKLILMVNDVFADFLAEYLDDYISTPGCEKVSK